MAHKRSQKWVSVGGMERTAAAVPEVGTGVSMAADVNGAAGKEAQVVVVMTNSNVASGACFAYFSFLTFC